MGNGADAFLALLADEGIDHLFGNPGTTELAIMAALPRHPELRYVLGLQESVALAMAEGYARASGRLAACNLHVAPGLGHATGALYNARWWGAPLLVTAGQHEQGHALTEPMLYAPLLPMAAPHVKWAVEVGRARDLPRVIRRAAKVALTPPAGPVFVSLPGDVMHEEAPADLGRRTRVEAAARPGDEALQRLAGRLLDARAPLIVAGHEVATAGALDEAARLAELLGAPAWQQTVPWGAHFPSEHPCFMGTLGREQARVREALAAHDVLLALGADVLTTSLPSPAEPMPESLAVLQIGQRDWELGKNYPAEQALRADVAATLRALLPLLEARLSPARRRESARRIAALRERNWSARREDLRARAAGRAGSRPIDPEWLMLRAVEALPRDAAVVDEGITASRSLPALLPFRDASSYFGLASGGLGFGLPGAVGVALALAPRPVLCVLGDGSAMYGIQGLWSAAHLELPVTFLVADNGGYRVLRERIASIEGSNAFTGMEITAPRIDFAGLARALGLEATTVDDPAGVDAALRAALASRRPHVVHARVEEADPGRGPRPARD